MFDKLFTNGKIYTLREELEYFEALGVKEGKIHFLGNMKEAEGLEAKEKIDLQGKALIPGMADSHMHLYAYCQNLTFVDLANVKNIDEMISLMKDKAQETPKGKWVKGVNFDQGKWEENRFPTLEEMDSISNEHPVLIKRTCLHAVVANSLALKEVGIGKGYKPKSGGVVELDENDQPTGLVREQTTKLFDDVIPDPLEDPEIREKYMSQVLQDMSSKGITSIHTYAAKIWQYNEDINFYKKLEAENKLPVRVTVCIDEIFQPEILTKEEKEDPYRRTQLGAYKIFSDGSMGSRSAALHEPYSDDPSNSGFMLFTQDELNEKVYNGYKEGLQPAIHAIGDRALDMTLESIEYTLEKSRQEGMTKEEQKSRLPFRLIHAQMTDKESIERMTALPIIIDIQPIFLSTDLHWIEDRIGPERKKTTFAMKSMIDAGLLLTGGSDCPVETYEPLKGIYTAVTRQDMEGYPPQGFLPEERISVYDALCMYSKNVHYATGFEDQLGTLEEGKIADLVILEENIFEVEKEKIKDLKIKETFLAGERVYQSK